jgi:hypothetical protein
MMTHHRRYQTATATAAAVLGLFGTHTALSGLWWETVLFGGVALVLVEASVREARVHRDALARERMAIAGEHADPLFVPCCQFWTASAGHIHAPDCPTWSTR